MARDDQTYGHYLLSETLPGRMQFDGAVTKKDLKEKMTAYAKRDPQGYVQTVQRIKALGDEVATLEGISVGLDDIAPDYKRRDPVLKDALKRIKAAKTDAEKRQILLETQGAMVKATHNHPSDMTIMAKSGGRGSVAQMMKIVASPVVAMDKGQVTPWLVTKSYSQGVNPADAWVTGVESRRNAIASSGSVVEPGMVSKVVMNNMDDLVISVEDCGTTGGILLKLSDQVQDRYLARDEGGIRRNTLVTPSVMTRLRQKKITRVLVRSATACVAQNGVCQKCVGLNEWGKPHSIGTNVGARSAQAMTEPLTQFALNAKHGVRLAGDARGTALSGLLGFRTLTEVPKSFMDQAAVSERDGRVDSVKRAPQGGWHIEAAGKTYYTPPGLKPIVREGSMVEAGDAISDGVALPNAVVRHKGIGAGRVYLSDQLTNLYRRQGVDIDRRHTELLARNAMRHVRIEDDPTRKFLRGDIVPYAEVQKTYASGGVSMPLGKAGNHLLSEQTLHFSAGTKVTPSVRAVLKKNRVSTVKVATNPTTFEPIMKSLVQAPLLNDDWMSRLSHRYLKRTLVEGAGFGQTTDISSTSPVPAYAMGLPFGRGLEGKYAELSDAFDAGAEEIEKLAAPVGMLRKILLGAPEEFAERMAKKGPEALKVISDAPWTAGGVDTAAQDAMRLMKRLPEGFMSEAGFIRDNTLTDEGAKFVRSLQGSEGKLRKGMPTLDPQRAGESVKRFGRRQERHGKDLASFEGFRQGLTPQWTPEIEQQFLATQPGKLQRAGQFAADLLHGQDPLTVMKQRAQMGGLAGRGGLLAGEMAIDPDVMRAYRAYKANPSLGTAGGMAMPVALDAFNKGMAYVAPGAMMYEAAKAPVGEGESRWENIAGTAGDALGWAIGSPFGMVTGGAFAAPFTAGAKAIGRQLDPNYTPQAPRPRTAPRPQGAPAPTAPQMSPWHQQAAQQAQQYGTAGAGGLWDSMQSHKYLSRLNMAGEAVEGAQETWEQLSPHAKALWTQQNQPQMPAPRPPLRSQMKKDFTVRPGHYPAREMLRTQPRGPGQYNQVAPGYRNQ